MSAEKEKLVDKKPSDPLYQRRAIMTFVLQSIPWASYTFIFIIDEIVQLSASNFEESSKTSLKLACFAFFGIVVALIVFGGMMSIKKANESLVTIMMFAFFIAFGGFSVTFAFMEILDKKGWFALGFGLPLLILCLGHFLFALCNKENPVMYGVSGVFVFCAAGIAITCMIIQDSVDPWINMPTASFLAGGLHALFASSWVTAVKWSITLEYFSLKIK